jgi:hypothetical protein
MEKINEKTKKLRKKVVKTFLMLFMPHIFVCLLTVQITTNPMDILKWQFCWFTTYFSISFLVYVFAPRIINKLNDSN